MRQTIKFADEHGDSEDHDENGHEDDNVLVVGKRRNTRITFGKFMSLEDLALDDDDDEDLGLVSAAADDEEDDDDDDENVLVI